MTKALEKFDAAVEAVNSHLHMYALIKAYQDSNDDHQLSVTDTVVLDNSPEDFKVLVEELEGIMCELFISAKGGNSPVYYQAKNLGYLLSVAEGPNPNRRVQLRATGLSIPEGLGVLLCTQSLPR